MKFLGIDIITASLATGVVTLLTATIGTNPANAATVFWTDWTTSSGNNIEGSINANSNTIGVTSNSSSGYYAPNTDIVGTGSDYWDFPSTYTSPEVDNAPAITDTLALSTGGTVTINFSETVLNPLLALVSWNGNTVDFGVPIEILSFGEGFFPGSGTPILNADGDGFSGQDEINGVVRVLGAYDSFSFTHTDEQWHGFTVGVEDIAEPVPEPMTILGTATALGFGALFKKRQAKKA